AGTFQLYAKIGRQLDGDGCSARLHARLAKRGERVEIVCCRNSVVRHAGERLGQSLGVLLGELALAPLVDVDVRVRRRSRAEFRDALVVEPERLTGRRPTSLGIELLYFSLRRRA